MIRLILREIRTASLPELLFLPVWFALGLLWYVGMMP